MELSHIYLAVQLDFPDLGDSQVTCNQIIAEVHFTKTFN